MINMLKLCDKTLNILVDGKDSGVCLKPFIYSLFNNDGNSNIIADDILDAVCYNQTRTSMLLAGIEIDITGIMKRFEKEGNQLYEYDGTNRYLYNSVGMDGIDIDSFASFVSKSVLEQQYVIFLFTPQTFGTKINLGI